MLCFVPASFDDLRLLVQGHNIIQLRQKREVAKDEEQAEDGDESSPAFMNVDSVEFVQKARDMHLSGNEVTVLGFPTEQQSEPPLRETVPLNRIETKSRSCDKANGLESKSNDMKDPQIDESLNTVPPDRPEPAPDIDVPQKL